MNKHDSAFYILEKHAKHNIHVAMNWYANNSPTWKKSFFSQQWGL